MKKISVLIVLCIHCSSGVPPTFNPIDLFEPLQDREMPQFMGKYFGTLDRFPPTSALLSVEKDKAQAIVYSVVKSEYSHHISDELKPVLKNYFFGVRTLYFKSDRAIFYKNKNNTCHFVFIGEGKTHGEMAGLGIIDLKKIDEKEYQRLHAAFLHEKKRMAAWWQVGIWNLDHWVLDNRYKKYKNDIIKLRDDHRRKVDFDKKVKTATNDELEKIDAEIRFRVLEAIDKPQKK